MSEEVREYGTGGDGYVRAYRSFLRLRELKHSDKMVFLGLWSFGNASGICWPSQKELAKASAVSPRQVRTSLNKLKGMGLVMTERRKTGRLSSLRYRLAPLERAALIVAGRKALEETKTRWIESLGETTPKAKNSGEEGTAIGHPARKELPPPPENGTPPEGSEKFLPLRPSLGESPRQDIEASTPKNVPDQAEKGQVPPQGTAVRASGAEISADRSRTRELKPGKKNQVPRPWERYLKPQSPRKRTTAGIPLYGQSVRYGGEKQWGVETPSPCGVRKKTSPIPVAGPADRPRRDHPPRRSPAQHMRRDRPETIPPARSCVTMNWPVTFFQR